MEKISFFAIHDDGMITEYYGPQTFKKVSKDFKRQCQLHNNNGILYTSDGWAVHFSGKERTLEKCYEIAKLQMAYMHW